MLFAVGVICFWVDVPAERLHVFLMRLFFFTPLGQKVGEGDFCE